MKMTNGRGRKGDEFMATGQFNIAELTLQKRLTALNRVVIQLMSVTSIDQLAHDAIAFGISLLGFDRLGLYFCSANDPKVITGTYGTDANGQLCGEHGTTIQMSEADWLFQAKFLRENHSWVVLHSTLYQPEPGMNQNQTVGQGWNAAAALWNGDQIVGYLFADNLLHHRPYSDDEGELLAAYGFALGHLMIRLRTEETLRQQQAHYRALLEAMPDLLFTLNRAGDVVDFHLPPGEHLLAPLDQLVGRNLCDLVPPPLATQVLQSIELAYRTGECAPFE
jgi:PAS domain-containing protein